MRAANTVKPLVAHNTIGACAPGVRGQHVKMLGGRQLKRHRTRTAARRSGFNGYSERGWPSAWLCGRAVLWVGCGCRRRARCGDRAGPWARGNPLRDDGTSGSGRRCVVSCWMLLKSQPRADAGASSAGESMPLVRRIGGGCGHGGRVEGASGGRRSSGSSSSSSSRRRR